MSAQNVELVRRLIAPAAGADLAWLFRDEKAEAALREELAPLFHHDFETVFHGPQASTWIGLDGWREGWLDWLAPWEGYRAEIEDVIDAGDRVIVVARDFGRRAGMEVEVEMRGMSVWTVRDGKVARVDLYPDRAEAVEALALHGPEFALSRLIENR